MAFPRTSNLNRAVLCCCATLSTYNAHATDNTGPDRLSYTIGAQFNTGDLSSTTPRSTALPVIGMRYGHWRLGIGDGREWLQFNASRDIGGLTYRTDERFNWQLSYSAQLRHTESDSSYTLGDKGPVTLRGQVALSRKLTPRTSIGVTWTQDVLGRGDGGGLGLGWADNWPINDISEVNFNVGMNWGTAQRWQIADDPSTSDIGAGWGSATASANYRRLWGQRTAWYTTVTMGRTMGTRTKALGQHVSTNVELGVLLFNR